MTDQIDQLEQGPDLHILMIKNLTWPLATNTNTKVRAIQKLEQYIYADKDTNTKVTITKNLEQGCKYFCELWVKHWCFTNKGQLSEWQLFKGKVSERLLAKGFF